MILSQRSQRDQKLLSKTWLVRHWRVYRVIRNRKLSILMLTCIKITGRRASGARWLIAATQMFSLVGKIAICQILDPATEIAMISLNLDSEKYRTRILVFVKIELIWITTPKMRSPRHLLKPKSPQWSPLLMLLARKRLFWISNRLLHRVGKSRMVKHHHPDNFCRLNPIKRSQTMVQRDQVWCLLE